ncbi:MAG: TerB family tellurite resistance protein [Pseudomonadota bacterium]
MHLILGFLTSVLTILYMLDRLGVDLGGLNPFAWARRRRFRKKYEGDPIYAVEDPMEIAALLVTGMARADGDITAEQKQAIEHAFMSTFSLSDKDAHQLLIASTHLLGATQVIHTQLEGLLKRTGDTFTRTQAESILGMVSELYSDALSEEQRLLKAMIRERLPVSDGPNTEWSR